RLTTQDARRKTQHARSRDWRITTVNDTAPAALSPRIEATPRRALVDEPIAIRLLGLEPDRSVAVRARTQDDQGGVWSAQATFRTDAGGTVDLRAQAPLSGSYDGVEPMGLFWSMTPQP